MAAITFIMVIIICLISFFHEYTILSKNRESEDVLHKGIIKHISFTSYPTHVNKDTYGILLDDGSYVTVCQTVYPPYNTEDAVTVIWRNGVYTFADGSCKSGQRS